MKTVFKYVKYDLIGRKWGNFHPKDPSSAELRQRLMQELQVEYLFVPSVECSTTVLDIDEPLVVFTDTGLLISTISADGGIIRNNTEVAIVIFTADCHIGLIYDPEFHTLCMIHMGICNIYREDYKEYTILEQAVKELRRPPEKLNLWIGGGIGPCCNGYPIEHPKYGDKNRERMSFLRKEYGPDVVEGNVSYGPRKGGLHVAHDNLKIIYRQALNLGFGKIICDKRCTSCFGMKDPNADGYGDFWSNVRDADREYPRNAFVARLLPR